MTDELEDRLEREIFAKTLNTLIQRTGKSYRQIAKEIGIPESTFFDMRMASRSYRYGRLDRIAEYFRKALNDSSITLKYLLLGSDEIREGMQGKIDEIKKELEKEKKEAAWKIIELKQQLSLFTEDSND